MPGTGGHVGYRVVQRRIECSQRTYVILPVQIGPVLNRVPMLRNGIMSRSMFDRSIWWVRNSSLPTSAKMLVLTLFFASLSVACQQGKQPVADGIEKKTNSVSRTGPSVAAAKDQGPLPNDSHVNEKSGKIKMTTDNDQGNGANESYAVPSRNPRIEWDPYRKGISRLIDTRTGDFFSIQETDHERRIIEFHFFKNGSEYMYTFRTQINNGDYKIRERTLVRVTSINRGSDNDKIDRRSSSITLKRFAEFLASWPYLKSDDTNNVIVTYGPARQGEHL